jgi:ABC-2 type transport system permease protein
MIDADAPGGSVFNAFARAQYSAVLRMRRQMLVHSLRSTRGKFELVARFFWIGFFLFVGLGLATGCGFIAQQLAAGDQLKFLPLLLWPILVLWQVIPVMLASAQENVDFSFLLRFPVSFRSYLLLYLVFGIFDPASLIGGVCVLGVFVGLLTVQPQLGLWFGLVLAVFAFFNFLLTRTIFAWIERWLARRKTREILGIVFLAIFVGVQLLNPAMRGASHNASHLDPATLTRVGQIVGVVQRPLPPGLTARSLEFVSRSRPLRAIATFGGLLVYVAGVGVLLGWRLRAEYRGENLGEAVQIKAPQVVSSAAGRLADRPVATTLKWLDGPIRAVVLKELRYLARSGVMLFSLFAPLVILFGAGAQLRVHHSPALQFAFPLAVAYSFLPLTRQVCNSLGGEGSGIQLYFLAPVRFRTVMLAKNLLQVVLFLIELTFVCLIVISKYGPPAREMAVLTLCWLLFALPVNLAVGNILSITMAYRMTVTRLSREQGSVGNGLLSLLTQLLTFAIGVAVYLPLAHFGRAGVAPPVLLLLAMGAVAVWLRVLRNVDRMAADRREVLISALSRAA